jgi:hypothetical protein
MELMRQQVLAALVGGVLGGFLFQAVLRPRDAFGGNGGISDSAYRMANALERIANVMEKK